MEFIADPGIQSGAAIAADIRVPGDKSISHRSIMLAAIAEGETYIHGFLEGEDALATLAAFRAMGVEISGPDNGVVRVEGVGLHGLKAPQAPLDLGNSGTSMRLLAGLLAGQSFAVTLTGDSSLSSRPMERVAAPLRQMGACIETAEAGRPPLKISPVDCLRGIDYSLPMASAQVKSCVLLAGLYANGETSTVEPAPTRDHSERMLSGFGYSVKRQGARASLCGGGQLSATTIDVPADISSAAFFIVAATIVPDSDLTLRHVGVNPTRTGIIELLRLMGADITLSNQREVGGEPVADIRVCAVKLQGIKIPEALVPLAIDEFPIAFIAAACAEGETLLSGAEELRVKESDRIQAMVDGLVALGIDASGTEDGAVIRGGVLGAGRDSVAIDSYHDHRIAMAFAIASLRSHCRIVIRDCDNVATSFPNFAALASELGVALQVVAESTHDGQTL